MNTKLKILVFLLFIFLIIISCGRSVTYNISPNPSGIESITVKFEISQNMKIQKEDIDSINEGVVQLDILSVNNQKKEFLTKINSYNIITKLGRNQNIDNVNDFQGINFNMILDEKNNITIKNMENEITEFNHTKSDIKMSMEMLFNLMLKNFPMEDVELKHEWEDELTIPYPIEANPDTIKRYNLYYKFDKITSGGATAEILFDGTMKIEGDGISESSGKVEGLLNFDLEKGFAVRLNIEEDYSFVPESDNPTDIMINQVTFINNELD
jgi:hypothetical protein